MNDKDRIDMDIFRVVTRAVAESDNLDTLVNQMVQLLVAALEIKGCCMFVLNVESEELELLAGFGLSTRYMSKGPVLADKSIGCTLKGGPVIVQDTEERSDLLQYPEEARKEGLRAIVSIPIVFNRESVGVLRLYHGEAWNISDRDVESLMVLGEIIGLAMMFTRLLNTVKLMNEAVQDLPMEIEKLLRER
jgi:signal transduction protein with GAF and PtsI domain